MAIPDTLRGTWLGLLGGAFILAGGALAAEPYRLVPGDTLEISYLGEGAPRTVRIDLDGEIRLIDVGSIAVAGKSLDEAETQIEDAIAQAGLFVDAEATLSVINYAPVVVTGDVTAPGRFDYLPGMTVAAALGLSGGSQATGLSSYELSRARTENEGLIATLNLDIAAAAVKIFRYQTEISGDRGAETMTELPAGLRQAIPSPDSVPLPQLVAAEAEILRNAEARTEELVALWQEEIDTIEAQRELFDQRIAVQEEVVTSVAADLESAQELQERGLQTASRLTTAIQREADARARALELETARVSASRSIAEAERQRAQHLRGKREEALRGLAESQVQLASLQLRHARAMEQQANLAGGNMATLIASEAVAVEFRILSPRADRLGPEPVTEETLLLPGDTLFVEIGVADLTREDG